jgi:hypothetical protein
MMNTRKIMMNAVTMMVAGNILLFINVSMAHGQIAGDKRDDSVTTDIPYTSESLRDPFQAYVQKEVAPTYRAPADEPAAAPLPSLKITGITWGSSYAQAIVNGKVVKAGDTIEGVQIVSISKAGLVLSYDNQQVTLPAPGADSAKNRGGVNSKKTTKGGT